MGKFVETCGGCGGPADQATRGCKACYQRQKRREAAGTAAPASAPEIEGVEEEKPRTRRQPLGMKDRTLDRLTDGELLQEFHHVRDEIRRRLEAKLALEDALRGPMVAVPEPGAEVPA